MTLYFAVYFLNDVKKQFGVVANTTIADGTKQDDPMESYVGKTLDFLWGTGKVKAKHLARVLYTRKYTIIMALLDGLNNSLGLMFQII
jgi:hypothetical protein